MVSISCSTKFWAFALAEQLEKNNLLHTLHTSYAYQKNTLARRFVSRVDKEAISPKKIQTYLPIAAGIKLKPNPFYWNERFDQLVASEIAKAKNPPKVFIGWSGMSLNSIRAAKKRGIITILERGSCHISQQYEILNEEYKRFGKTFNRNVNIHDKELKEYEEADYISVASSFVKNSFIEYGIDCNKIFVNAYGAGSFFKKDNSEPKPEGKFIVLYLGGLMIRKGLIYLFDALKDFNQGKDNVEFWFMGGIRDEVKDLIAKYRQDNWKFWGHVNHYELPKHISKADVSVVPSLEDGFGMVVPQMLSCGVPVITTVNTGSSDLIEEDVNGYVVPIRDAQAILDKLNHLYNNPDKLSSMKENAVLDTYEMSWDAYGDRYAQFLRSII